MKVSNVQTVITVEFDDGELIVNGTASYSGTRARFQISFAEISYETLQGGTRARWKLFGVKLKKDGEPSSRPSEWLRSGQIDDPESRNKVNEIVKRFEKVRA